MGKDEDIFHAYVLLLRNTISAINHPLASARPASRLCTRSRNHDSPNTAARRARSLPHSKMSAILSVDTLNDFISPGVACIKPVETLPAKPQNENVNSPSSSPLSLFIFFQEA